jgi:hypothetical protein
MTAPADSCGLLVLGHSYKIDYSRQNPDGISSAVKRKTPLDFLVALLLDAQRASKSRIGEAMDDASESSSCVDCRYGILHGANAHFWSPLLLLHHCA